MRISLCEPMTAFSLPANELVCGLSDDISFSGIATDSEQVCEGDLFLAFRGERHDGNDYIKDALAKGAAFAVSETQAGEKIVRCRRLISLLYEMAKERLNEIAPRVVAVTGSVGKSTYLAYASTLLSQRMRLHLPSGNYNTDIGLPMTVLCMPRTTELLLLEMGARHLGEIARLSLLVKPHIAVLTRIGHSHLETLGDLRGVLRAKSEIILGLRENGTLLYNHDDSLLRVWSQGLDCRRIGVSLGDGNGALTLSEASKRGELTLKFGEVRIDGILLKTRGEASELAAALSAATALLLGVPNQQIRDALSLCRAPSMRQEKRIHDGILYIMDAYNASPESSRAALELLKDSKVPGRRYALLGDMLELGCDAEALHFSLGISAVKAGVTDLYCIGRLGEKTAEGAAFAGLPRERIRLFERSEKARLCEILRQELKKGDALLLKGSRALGLESVLSSLTE